jgi:hypothetical protein
MSVEYANGSVDGVMQGASRYLARRLGNLRERLSKGLVFDAVQVGLRMPVTPETFARKSKLPLTVRPITAEDLDELLPNDAEGLDRVGQYDIAMRRQLAELVPECGYAVVDERSGRVCYLQWLIGADRNDAIAQLEGLPQLEEGEIMVEGAYAPPTQRGRMITFASAEVVMAYAASRGAKALITFVGEAHSVSMRGAYRLGFRPYMLHVRRHWLFGIFQRDTFSPVSPDDPRFIGKF